MSSLRARARLALSRIRFIASIRKIVWGTISLVGGRKVDSWKKLVRIIREELDRGDIVWYNDIRGIDTVLALCMRR